jgi:hypothetical protein
VASARSTGSAHKVRAGIRLRLTHDAARPARSANWRWTQLTLYLHGSDAIADAAVRTVAGQRGDAWWRGPASGQRPGTRRGPKPNSATRLRGRAGAAALRPALVSGVPSVARVFFLPATLSVRGIGRVGAGGAPLRWIEELEAADPAQPCRSIAGKPWWRRKISPCSARPPINLFPKRADRIHSERCRWPNITCDAGPYPADGFRGLPDHWA